MKGIHRTTNSGVALARVRPARIRVLSGSSAGAHLEVPAVGMVIGTGAGSDLRLRDSLVDARHCTVQARSHGFRLRDLGTRHGTFVDGVRIEEMDLPIGGSFRVGATTLQVLPEEHLAGVAKERTKPFGGLVGESSAMREVASVLAKASRSTAPVLLLGESGTGKELAARALHQEGPRRDGPFVVFDCGAASDTLMETELFGHERGAFTGAHDAKVGAFARAHGGTLFLDEIGELPLPLQPKLLRLLETGEVRRLGGKKHEHFDVRIVAATHRDLEELVSQGFFRGDLFYRLAVLEVHMPPLRERREDIPLLLEYFVRREREDLSVPATSESLRALEAHSWPGNLRELRNAVTRAVALAPPTATFDELDFAIGRRKGREAPAKSPRESPLRPFHDEKAEVVSAFEVDYLTRLLERYGQNLSEAAERADLARRHLYRLLAAHGKFRPRTRRTS